MNIAPALRRALFPLLLALAGPAALAAPAANGEVIVKFRADAAVTRQHALAAQADAATVRSILANRARTLGARTGRTLEAGHAVSERIQVVRAAGVSATELARQLAADPDVEFAVPNERMRRAAGGTGEPLYLTGPAANDVTLRGGPVVGQWYLRAPAGEVVSSINVEPAWLRSAGANTVVVAVLDTGVRREHPDFAGQTFLGYDFASDPTYTGDGDDWDADPTDPGDGVSAAEAATTPFSSIGCGAENSSWHGTATSSLVGAAANGVGMSGVAPGIQLLHVRVLSKCGGSTADIIAGMRWAAGLAVPGVPLNTHPAKVLNMSLGGDATTCSTSYQDAVNDVMTTGAVVVVSAGNSNGTAIVSLATCRGVIPVAAVRHSGTKVGFSSLGPEVAISAPGGNCVNDPPSACVYPLIAASNTGTRGPVASSWFDSYTYEVGTSFSAPLVAGTVALMFSVQPALTPAQARAVLLAAARPFPARPAGSSVPQCQAPSATPQIECYCTTTTCGAGMLDAGAAVAAAVTATPGPTARITYTPAAPTAGSTITFDSSTSTATTGSTITATQWTLVSSGGIISGLVNGGTIATSRTATLTPTGAGTFTVSLLVTDGLANSGLASQTVTVAAAPVPGGGLGGGNSGGGGGGGALSLPWLLLLALAVLLLFRTAPRRA